MRFQKYSQPFAVALLVITASLSFGAQRAEAAFVPYNGEVDTSAGTVGLLLGTLPIPAVGLAEFDDITRAVLSINFRVGGFFFSSLWTGNCLVTPSDGTCMTTDPNEPVGTTFVPISAEVSNTLTFGGGPVPTGGVYQFDTFSVTFGLPLGVVTLDQTNGVFDLSDVGLGSASGTGMFVPVPGAVWLFGSALLGLAGLRRRWVATK